VWYKAVRRAGLGGGESYYLRAFASATSLPKLCTEDCSAQPGAGAGAVGFHSALFSRTERGPRSNREHATGLALTWSMTA
jgi:hypothetical protein